MTEAIVYGVEDSDRAQDAAGVPARLCADLDRRLTVVPVAPRRSLRGVAPPASAYPGEGEHEDSIEAGKTLLAGLPRGSTWTRE